MVLLGSVLRVSVALLVAFCLVRDGFSQIRTWTDLSDVPSPSARSDAAMVAIPSRDQVLLFGGLGADSVELGDTWLRDAAGWRRLDPVNAPSRRRGQGICYDATNDRVILVGGWVGNAVWRATWQWDGNDWSQLPSPPVALYRPTVFHDALRHTVHAVETDDRTWSGWSFDGSAWHSWAAAGAPSRVVSGGFDPRRDRFVALAIEGSAGAESVAIHEFDGTTWQRVLGGVGRSNLFGAATLLPDPAGDGLLIQPLDRSSVGRSVIHWDGVRLRTVLVGSDQGYSRSRQSVCAVRVPRPGMLLFGGRRSSSAWLDETWLLEGADQASAVDRFGIGCAGSRGTPDLHAIEGSLPILGQSLELRIRALPVSRLSPPFGLIGFSRDRVGGTPLPIDLAPIGMPGCSLLVSAELDTALDNLGGYARWSFPIPFDPTLIGAEVYLQAFALDPGIHALGATMSNGLVVRLGTS